MDMLGMYPTFYVPYIGTCSKKVLWWTVYYPCVKLKLVCF